jgi:F0F1-type ATP synthase delta subunit
VVFEEKIDEGMIGGMILEIEDTRCDGSIRTNLNSLKNILAKSKI